MVYSQPGQELDARARRSGQTQRILKVVHHGRNGRRYTCKSRGLGSCVRFRSRMGCGVDERPEKRSAAGLGRRIFEGGERAAHSYQQSYYNGNNSDSTTSLRCTMKRLITRIVRRVRLALRPVAGGGRKMWSNAVGTQNSNDFWYCYTRLTRAVLILTFEFDCARYIIVLITVMSLFVQKVDDSGGDGGHHDNYGDAEYTTKNYPRIII